MPRGLLRFHDTGNTHFITFSCFERRPYLRSTEARALVEDGLERTRRRYTMFVFGYVIMPEHVHALLSEPVRGTIADVMKAWKLSVTLRQKRRPFWEKRYHDFTVFSNEKRVEKLRYVHRNPVAPGLVEKPEDWSWSSFDHYATGVKRTVEVESPWTARLRARAVVTTPGSEMPEPGHPGGRARR